MGVEVAASASTPWMLAALALAAVCAVQAVLLWRGCRGGGAVDAVPEEANVAGALSVQVGSLHEQGARPDQQDSFSVSDEQRLGECGLLAVVADGMGGLADGGRVSRCVTAAMTEGFYRTPGSPRDVLLSLVEQAEAAVNAELGPDGLNRSGSTLAAGIVKGSELHFVSVGDSRVALYRGGGLIQLNRDHILARDLEVWAINRLASWEDVAANPRLHGLTSFLGMGKLKYVDIPSQAVALLPGDRVIFMSDGVYNALSDRELAAELDKPAQEAADAIRGRIAAKQYKRQDNYTAIVLAFGRL